MSKNEFKGQGQKTVETRVKDLNIKANEETSFLYIATRKGVGLRFVCTVTIYRTGNLYNVHAIAQGDALPCLHCKVKGETTLKEIYEDIDIRV